MAVIPMPDPHRPVLAPEGDESPELSSTADGRSEGGEQDTQAGEKKKKDKVRAAWIAFVGRIVAQVVGAIVTVALTLFVVQRSQQAPASPPVDTTASPPTVAPPGISATAPPMQPQGEMALAVLPLENFSGDPAQDSFADGMTEALIAELAQIKGIRVISRTSSMQYRGTRQPLPDIARALGVTHLIEGSVARDKARVRVTAQLIEGRSDRHLWARSYDRTVRDVLTMQAEVAEAIAGAIGGTVGATAQSRPARTGVNSSVYD